MIDIGVLQHVLLHRLIRREAVGELDREVLDRLLALREIIDDAEPVQQRRSEGLLVGVRLLSHLLEQSNSDTVAGCHGCKLPQKWRA